MELCPRLRDCLRKNSSQGYLECSAVVLFFSLAYYAHFDDSVPLLQASFALPLIAAKLYSCVVIGRYYWDIILPLALLLGSLYSRPLMFSGIESILYFQMVQGLDKVFTAGEHLMNAFVLSNILRFSTDAATPELRVIYYPMGIFVLFMLAYALARRMLKASPEGTFSLASVAVLGYVLSQASWKGLTSAVWMYAGCEK